MSGISPKNAKLENGWPVQIPAGEYVVVDPCYFLGEDPFWGEFCTFLSKNGHRDMTITVDGDTKILVWGTAYGDGCYNVYENRNPIGQAYVDAGLLCVVPAEYFNSIEGKICEIGDGCVKIAVRQCIPNIFNDDSDVRLGHIEVFTRDDPYQSEDEEEDYSIWKEDEEEVEEEDE